MKFKVVKKYSLAYLGDEWNDCYLEFNPVTIKDVTGDFGKLATVDQEDKLSVLEASEKTLKLLKDRFVSGYGINEKGERVEVKADDLEDLPAEVLGGVVGFLSQSLAETSQKQSGISSQEE